MNLRTAAGTSRFESTTLDNATASDMPRQFNTAKSGGLPAAIPYGTSYRVYVMDEDIDGADDQVGWITVNLPGIYGNDNAPRFDHTFQDSNDRIRIHVVGDWTY